MRPAPADRLCQLMCESLSLLLHSQVPFAPEQQQGRAGALRLPGERLQLIEQSWGLS